jgi:uncharacterized protein YcaQ
VLPVLYGDRFIARLDPGFDKKNRILTITNWWWEEGVKPDQSMVEALIRCLGDFMIYLDVKELKYSKTLFKKRDLEWLGDLST